MDRQLIARLNMLALGRDTTSDDHGRGYILEAKQAGTAVRSHGGTGLRFRRAYFWMVNAPSPAGVIPVTRRTYG